MDLLDDINIDNHPNKKHLKLFKGYAVTAVTLGAIATIVMNTMSPAEFERTTNTSDYGPTIMFTVIGIAVVAGIIAVYNGMQYLKSKK